MAREKRSEGENPAVQSGRFYSALANLSEPNDSPRTSRRKAMALLQEIAASTRSRSRNMASSTGHHASTHHILVLTYRSNDEHVIRVRDIQRALGFTAGGVTRRLDAMIADGLILREPDPDDGRALLARLTPEGVQLAETLLQDSDGISQRLEAAFTPGEWKKLLELLSRFAQAL